MDLALRSVVISVAGGKLTLLRLGIVPFVSNTTYLSSQGQVYHFLQGLKSITEQHIL